MAEDRRVALAALAVTAVVGVGAPVGTVIATNRHDDRRLHLEAVRTDRPELRKVLDQAAARLYTVGTRFEEVASRRQRIAQVGAAAVFRPLKGQLDLLAQEYSRVSIRLGPNHRATVAFLHVMQRAQQADLYLRRRRPRGFSTPRGSC